ncbi:MAG: biopolymer transporter ExbD [Nitrospirota bacterium]|nr:biopolymer transporter ExbD [Nitrospirota bacterium]
MLKRTGPLRRMESRARARAGVPGLNIVALLDIFTILLLFLLVQAGDPEEALPVLSNLKLPFSEARQTPKRDLVIAIDSAGSVLLEGQPVARVDEVLALEGDLIPGLSEALGAYLEKAAEVGRAEGQKFRGRVVIMGDRQVPFAVLKRVMATCSARHFGHISLAVQQREEPAR